MKKKLLNNGKLKIATLIFAFIFWRFIGELADPVTTRTFYNIPVTVLSEDLVTDMGKVYQIENSDGTVNVVIKAETSLLNEIDEADIYATADFEEIELGELVPVRIEIDGYESDDFEAISNPVNLIVVVEDSVSKKFPIVPSSIGTIDENYDLGTMTTLPETVIISGPESLVSSIARVEAQINITDITEDSSVLSTLTFYDESNVVIDSSLLTINLGEYNDVYVNVQILDIKSVDLQFTTSGTPETGYQVASVTSEPTSIVISALQEVLDTIDVIEIPSSALNVTGLSGKVDLVVDVLEYLPEDVKLYDENNNTIAVTIVIDKLGTKSIEFPVQSIIVNNNPENLTLSYDGISDVMVTFSGLADVMDELDASNVQLSIDLNDCTKVGEYEVAVTVTAPEGYEVEEVIVPIILTSN